MRHRHFLPSIAQLDFTRKGAAAAAALAEERENRDLTSHIHDDADDVTSWQPKTSSSSSSGPSVDVDSCLKLMLNMSRVSNIQQLMSEEMDVTARMERVTKQQQEKLIGKQSNFNSPTNNSQMIAINNNSSVLSSPSSTFTSPTSPSPLPASDPSATTTLFKFHHLFLEQTARNVHKGKVTRPVLLLRQQNAKSSTHSSV